MPLKVIKVSQLQGHNAAIFDVFPDGKEEFLFTTGGDGWLVKWDLNDTATGKLIARTDIQNFTAIQVADNHFVCGNMHGGVHFIDLLNPEDQKNIQHHKKGVFSLIETNGLLYSGGGDGKITRWDTEKHLPSLSYQISHASIRKILSIPELGLLVIGTSDNNIYGLHAEDLSICWTIEKAHENSVFSLAYLPQSKTLVSGGRDAMLRFWDLSKDIPSPVHAIPAHIYTINDIVYCQKPNLIATASRDRTIKLWDASTYALLKVLEGPRDGGHFNSVNKLCWLNSRSQLVSVGDDRIGYVWGIKRE